MAQPGFTLYDFAIKRGEGAAPASLDGLDLPAPVPDERLVKIHEALDELEQNHAEQAQIVKLRFFSGMTNEEVAGLLDVSSKTVRRRWKMAKLWLYRSLKDQ